MTQEKPDQSLDEPWGHDGVTHLRELGRAPRAAGSAEEREAREYGAAVLRNLGFDVTLESFSYSTFPGRYGTPVGGAIAAASVLLTFWLVIIEGAVVAGSIAFGAGLLLLVLFVWSMLGDGVLELPWSRADGHNLIARRGEEFRLRAVSTRSGRAPHRGDQPRPSRAARHAHRQGQRRRVLHPPRRLQGRAGRSASAADPLRITP